MKRLMNLIVRLLCVASFVHSQHDSISNSNSNSKSNSNSCENYKIVNNCTTVVNCSYDDLIIQILPLQTLSLCFDNVVTTIVNGVTYSNTTSIVFLCAENNVENAMQTKPHSNYARSCSCTTSFADSNNTICTCDDAYISSATFLSSLRWTFLSIFFIMFAYVL